MRAARVCLVLILIVGVAHLCDQWAWHHLVRPDIYDHDYGRMFRVMGYLPVWWIVALGIWLQTRDAPRAVELAVLPTIAGILCALLQVLIRRERPGLHDGAYVFRPWHDRPLHGAEFGLPSSHAMVAFTAAWLLSRWYPRAAPLWIALAVGCAITRVLAQAHFLSDVTAGAVVAWMIVAGPKRSWELVASS